MKKEFRVEGWKVENSMFLENRERRGFGRKSVVAAREVGCVLGDEKSVDFDLI